MNDFIIRRALKKDKNNIYEVIRSCSIDMFEKKGLEHWIPAYSLENIARDYDEKEIYVIESNNEIIGTFMLSTKKSYLWNINDDNSIYLSKLAIKPELSGNGFGRKCMEYIENYAKESNKCFIRFDVYEKADAVNFYEKLNYLNVGITNTRRFKVILMEKKVI